MADQHAEDATHASPRARGGEQDAHDHGLETHHDHDEHAHGHDHAHGHEDGGHHHAGGLRGLIGSLFAPHSHDAADSVDTALESSQIGIRTVQLSLIGLGMTALFQFVIVLLSGSVALLADTIHNLSDALTAVPLWLAFALGRRAATRRYTYGYGRAEDLAGLFIVAMIALSCIVAGWESVSRLIEPRPITHTGWVIAAGLIGFAGNEAVAVYRIRAGRRIGSAALIADGYHARTDGLTSLAVLFGALGSLAGFDLADPLVGILITVTILFVLKGAVVQVWHRLMDASDPELVHRFEHVAGDVPGVEGVDNLRVRWLGHRLEADLRIIVNEEMPTRESHAVGEAVRHALLHAEPKLATVIVHVDPCGHAGPDPHAVAGHHG